MTETVIIELIHSLRDVALKAIECRKWESIVERIKNDTFDVTEEIGKYYESHKISGVDKDTWVGVHKMPESIENYVTKGLFSY